MTNEWTVNAYSFITVLTLPVSTMSQYDFFFIL